MSERVSRVTVGLEYRRTPRPEWQAALEAVAPRSEVVSWLLLRWEPGRAWEPVQRWVIWQMLPVARIHPDLLAELRGPHPRSEGHACFPGVCPCARKRNRWVDGAAKLVTAEQWELFRETGALGHRWWVVQGTNGGHRYRLDDLEKRVLDLNGFVGAWPTPGDLPYAEPDARTFAAVGALDKVRAHRMLTEFLLRSSADLEREEREACEASQAALWRWLEHQVTPHAADLAAALRKDDSIPRPAPWQAGAGAVVDGDRLQHEFITQGV